jgi:pyridoxal phosphate enzyme (YggS family)
LTDIAANLADVKARIAAAAHAAGRDPASVTLVAVSKTHDAVAIAAAIAAGQRCFGENRVQEAEGKYPALRAVHVGLELHLIGPLQTNKVKDAVALFDVIETLDRPKLAEALLREMARQQKRPRLFIEINTGAEPQKAGGADVRTAGGGRAGPAFCAAARDRAAQRARTAQHGHEQRLRDRDPLRCHACARRDGDFRKSSVVG